MLGKLLKYEFKATGRILLPLYGALLVFAALCKLFSVNNVFHGAAPSFLGKVSILISVFGYGCTMAAVFVVTFFIIVQRFYKNILGDEGYLMNTLPVTPWQNILSKLLIGLLWSIVSCFVAGISIIILAYSQDLFTGLIPALISGSKELFDYWGINVILVSVECIAAALLEGAVVLCKIYASISLGHLFNKRKILASFGAFIGISILVNIILAIGAKIIMPILQNIDVSTLAPTLVTNLLLLAAIAFNAVFFAAYFFITNYVVKNKLNLE